MRTLEVALVECKPIIKNRIKFWQRMHPDSEYEYDELLSIYVVELARLLRFYKPEKGNLRYFVYKYGLRCLNALNKKDRSVKALTNIEFDVPCEDPPPCEVDYLLLKLRPQDRDIAGFLMMGFKESEIARMYGITPQAINQRVKRICDTLLS